MGDFRRRPEHRHTIEKPLYPMGAPSSGADATPKGGLRAVLTYTEDCVQPSLFQSLFCTGACETLDVHLFFFQELYLTPVLKFNLMLTCINNPLFFCWPFLSLFAAFVQCGGGLGDSLSMEFGDFFLPLLSVRLLFFKTCVAHTLSFY